MDTLPVIADGEQLNTAEMMFINSKKTAVNDNMPRLFGIILDIIKKHSLTKDYPMFAKFVLGGHQFVGSIYDIRTYYPKFGQDEIEALNIIDRIRDLLEDPTLHGFVTHIEEDDVNEHRALQQKLIVDWSNPKKH
jgi:hypothetical protein